MRALRDINTDDLVRLDKLLSLSPARAVDRAHQGRHRGQGGHGIAVPAAAAEGPHRPRIGGRSARVLNVRDRGGPTQPAVPMPAADLAETMASHGGEVPRLPDASRTIHGAIVRLLEPCQAAGQARFVLGDLP